MKPQDPNGRPACLLPLRCAELYLILWLTAAFSAQAASFTASLDRTTIALGESATLSLIFEGGTPKRLPIPQVQNLTLQSLGRSSQITAVNGQMSSSVSFNFQVTASKPGDYVIPSIQVEIENQTLRSQPV